MCELGLPLMWKAYAPSRRESQPSRAPSTSPASGASGTAVITLTTTPSAKPNTPPSPMAAPTPIWASLCSVHQRGDAPSQLRTRPLAFNTRAGYAPRRGTKVARGPPGSGSFTPCSQTNADTQRSSPRRSPRTGCRRPKRDRRPASLLLWRRSRQCPRRCRVPGNATVLSASSSAALRSRRLRKGGPQDTQNGPPSVASRKYGPSSAMPS
jgi:hypothetical protein